MKSLLSWPTVIALYSGMLAIVVVLSLTHSREKTPQTAPSLTQATPGSSLKVNGAPIFTVSPYSDFTKAGVPETIVFDDLSKGRAPRPRPRILRELPTSSTYYTYSVSLIPYGLRDLPGWHLEAETSDGAKVQRWVFYIDTIPVRAYSTISPEAAMNSWVDKLLQTAGKLPERPKRFPTAPKDEDDTPKDETPKKDESDDGLWVATDDGRAEGPLAVGSSSVPHNLGFQEHRQ